MLALFEGLAWFAAVVCSLILVIKFVFAQTTRYKNRNIEPPTKELPSNVCPIDAGTWGKWSAIYEERRVNDPSYPTIGGHHIVRSQTRTCEDCGYGERRVL